MGDKIIGREDVKKLRGKYHPCGNAIIRDYDKSGVGMTVSQE